MKKTFRVHRYWTVEYVSVAEVEADDAAEAAKLAVEGDYDYGDAESVMNSDGPVAVGRVCEVTATGEEIEVKTELWEVEQ